MMFFTLLTILIFSFTQKSQDHFKIISNPNTSDKSLGVFSKYVDVFGCGIYAEKGVPDEKVLYAASIWAELLDNNEDGKVDDPFLLKVLREKNAFMPIFLKEESSSMKKFFKNYKGEGVSAVLWESEIDPSQPGHWGDDATIEEILHTINAVGHSSIYPKAFGLKPNTSLLTNAMDKARAGQFMKFPKSYPKNAWYHYDDSTCDYQCMAIEYLYWMIVSNMEILNDSKTCNRIDNEWELCSSKLLSSKDLMGYSLITSPKYKIPQNAPNGKYYPDSTSSYTEHQ